MTFKLFSSLPPLGNEGSPRATGHAGFVVATITTRNLGQRTPLQVLQKFGILPNVPRPPRPVSFILNECNGFALMVINEIMKTE